MAKKSSWQVIAIGVLMLMVGVLMGWWLSPKQSQETPSHDGASTSPKPTATPVMTVEAIIPTPTLVAQTITTNGVVKPKQMAEVSGHLTGSTIEQVLVDVGDKVKKGQVLAYLDSELLQDSLIQAQADVEQAKAAYAKAQADVARVEPLLVIDAVSRQEVDAYKTAITQSASALLASQARLKSATSNLKRTQIVAPVSGVVSAKTAQVGMLVTGASLFSIIKDGQLEWQATLTPSQAAQISVGQTATLNVGQTIITAKVSHLSPTTNSGREIIAHVVLPSDAPLKAGMYQTGEFVLSSEPKLAIPISALMTTDGYDYVWTLHKANPNDHTSKDEPLEIYQVKRTQVTSGDRVDGQVMIALPQPMAMDTKIVRQSGSFLNDGDLVRVLSQSEQTRQTQGQ